MCASGFLKQETKWEGASPPLSLSADCCSLKISYHSQEAEFAILVFYLAMLKLLFPAPILQLTPSSGVAGTLICHCFSPRHVSLDLYGVS